MAKVDHYRKHIEEVIRRHSQVKPAYGELAMPKEGIVLAYHNAR